MKNLMAPDATLLLQQAFGFLFLFAGIYALFAYGIRRRYGIYFSPWLSMMLFSLGIPHVLSGQAGFLESEPNAFWFHTGLLAMLLFPVGLWRLMETSLGPGKYQSLRRCWQLQLLMTGLLWLPSALQIRPFDASSQQLGNLALVLQLTIGLFESLRYLRGPNRSHYWLALSFLIFCIAGLFDSLTALMHFNPGVELYPVSVIGLILVIALDQERLLGKTHCELLRHRQDLEALVQERTAALEIATRDAQAASRAKSEFLANMSHELRTPLNTILGFAALLKRGTDPSTDVAKRAELIRTSGEHLLRLLTDVLDLAKLEAGKTLVQTESCDLRSLVEGAAEMMRPLADSRNLNFQVHLSEAVPFTFETDPRRLRQILLNLLGNALKFTQHGWVQFNVRATNGELEFEVCDSGPGIAKADLDRIFESFEQLPSALSHEGSGLGLAISRKLADQLGGKLQVQSEPGRGSCFQFLLPVSEDAVNGSPTQPEALPTSFRRLQELVDLGDVGAIQQELKLLQASHPGHSATLREWIQLADACDIQALQKRLSLPRPSE